MSASGEVITVQVRGSCSHTWTVKTSRGGLIPYAGDAPAASHVVDQRARFRCPECGILATVVRPVNRRVCSADGCDTVLSRYNRDPDGLCAFHALGGAA